MRAGRWLTSCVTGHDTRSSLLRLRDSLRVELGGVLVFTCPNRSGKTTVLKDLAVLMRRNDTFVAYIDCRLSKGVVSATECVYTSLGLTKEAAREVLGPLLPGQQNHDHY